MARAGLSGVAVGTATVGGLLLYSGLTGVPVVQAVRGLSTGQAPAPLSSAVPASGASLVGGRAPGAGPASGPVTAGGAGAPALASAAMKYLGVPYAWGGTDPRKGLDCSGLVIVAMRDIGAATPGKRPRARTSLFWNAGSYIVNRKDAQPGDLVCWTTHIGIATDAGARHMVHAPHTGDVVKVSPVWGVPVIRRLGVRPRTNRGD